MSKFALRLSVATLAICLTVPVVSPLAMAESNTGPNSFLESIFGLPLRRQDERPRTLMGRFRDNHDETRPTMNRRTAAPVIPAEAPVKQRVVADPEPVPGLGMGNIDYIAPKLVPLVDAGLISPAESNGMATAIRSELTNPQTTIMVGANQRKPIIDLYQSEQFKPLWIEAGALQERSKLALAFAASVSNQGLDPVAYLPDGLTSFDNVETQLANDPQKLAHFDVAMTAAMLKLSHDLSGGQFEPGRLSKYNDITPQAKDTVDALDVLALTPHPEEWFKQLEPQHPAYALMKAELARLRTQSGENPAPPIAQGKTVKQGASDKRIPSLRARLSALGYYKQAIIFGAESQMPDAEVLDKDLSEALAKYQSSVALAATGTLNNATLKKLNPANNQQNIERLIVNMERVRWLPKELGTRYVFVNQPAFQVQVFDAGKEVWKSKVIVGKPMTQTAAFHDEIETVVFNPTWGVPQSIIINEYLKKLRNDPGYLDREGFTVVNSKGKVVSSASVDWSNYSKANPYSVIQDSGSDNALGELKFLFPNSHDIYMHDTPSRELFAKDVRAFSHGCVRVENPREFASVLLGWDRSRVDEETDSGEHHSVSLPEKVPVHITYFTAWPDEQGKITYYDDIYGRDAAMSKAISATNTERGAELSQKLVQN